MMVTGRTRPGTLQRMLGVPSAASVADVREQRIADYGERECEREEAPSHLRSSIAFGRSWKRGALALDNDATARYDAVYAVRRTCTTS